MKGHQKQPDQEQQPGGQHQGTQPEEQHPDQLLDQQQQPNSQVSMVNILSTLT